MKALEGLEQPEHDSLQFSVAPTADEGAIAGGLNRELRSMLQAPGHARLRAGVRGLAPCARIVSRPLDSAGAGHPVRSYDGSQL